MSKQTNAFHSIVLGQTRRGKTMPCATQRVLFAKCRNALKKGVKKNVT
jgi:hypothetical protein